MKQYVLAIYLFFSAVFVLNAQHKVSPSRLLKSETDSTAVIKKDTTHTLLDVLPPIYGWKITPRLGEQIRIDRDTSHIGFHQTSLTEGQGVAVSYLGNIGTAAQSKVFFEREASTHFTFLDNFSYWRKNPEDQLFLNTKIPYSNIYYQTGGGGAKSEDRFMVELSSNAGKKLNFGFNFDYLYARGFYTALYNKATNYDFYSSYIGNRYKMHAFVANNNLNNAENGGILRDSYITNPETAEDNGLPFRGTSREIPVVIGDTWNRMRGRHIYVTNKYDLGSDEEEYAVNDSTTAVRKKKDYVPLASAIFTSHYTDQRRRFISTYDDLDQGWFEGRGYQYYNNNQVTTTPKYTENVNDYMSYWSFKNTVALAMNEGFRKWTKFGLTAFAEYDMQRYSLPGGLPGLQDVYSQNELHVGGILSKEQGESFRYKALAQKDLLNSNFQVEGELTTILKIKNKELSVKGTAYIKNRSPRFFENHFSSKYWTWNHNFEDTRRVYFGGEIVLPSLSFVETKFSGGVENVQNYIYYAAGGLPEQESSNVQIVALRANQKLHAGIFHWDNQVVFQTTSNSEVVPLPTLSFYTNIYLSTIVSKVLKLQLGVDAHYHTKYYAPGYQPITLQYYNQREIEIGNFPLTTAYVNLHLKNTRFFLMMYNIAAGIGDKASFTSPHYPVNPQVMKLGVSWNFNN